MRMVARSCWLAALAAVAALAQITPPSVMIDLNLKGSGVAPKVEAAVVAQLESRLRKEVPCVAVSDTGMIRDALERERVRQLLSTDPNDDAGWLKRSQALGQSLASTYIISVTATSMPNGQTYVSASALDRQNARIAARNGESGATGSAASKTAVSVADKLFQDLLPLLNAQCEAHWEGTVSRVEESLRETKDGSPATRGGVTESGSAIWRLEHKVEVSLLPVPRKNKSIPKAQVAHSFDNHSEERHEKTYTMTCRLPGRNPVRKVTKDSNSETMDEKGSTQTQEDVSVQLEPATTSFEIGVSYPALNTKWTQVRVNTPGSCEAAKTDSEETSGEGTPFSESYRSAGFLRVRGTYDDPAHPDLLFGSQVTGSLDTIRTTIRWDLRFVVPKPK